MMMRVPDAFAAVLAAARDFGTESVPFDAVAGRVLRERVTADRAFPPFDRVTMDGIAIHFDSYQRGQRIFGLEDLAAAGMPQLQLANFADCIEVMTGAVLPEGTDSVVPYEHLEITEHEGFRRFNILKPVAAGQNIHRLGSDVPSGATLLEPGIVIGAAEAGVLATVGKTEVTVSRRPRVMLIATGNELVPVADTPEPHQIRMSNIFSLRAALQQAGIEAEYLHLPDDTAHLREALGTLIAKTDVLVCTGAVSAGRFDHLPDVLLSLGAKKVFHAVQQRPGKPLLFCTFNNGPAVFGLPGNPVSGFMCCYRYVLPFLKTCMRQLPSPQEFAVLEEDVVFDKPLEYYLPVRLSMSPTGVLSARPVPYHGSGDLASLLHADAFLALPAEQDTFPKGSSLAVWRFR
ncbi:molybdopterin molybdenumtransferase MoeA [Chitinophaga lutea]|uniref:Molybdopterin molybdenumtransferase n=1 Tax=Chitinophaga lutea TaxID=2488634 RepID=A0A3N4PW26_9BACT|nr:molybdopterin molybdotransferase MoeA [Chitinophaga lutea]RPE09301.1 molybdopterin molybdenumtransferase MoeA [Chitinophaga lutea]